MKRSAEVNLLVERAEEDAAPRRRPPQTSPPPAPEPERRYVFNGDRPRPPAGFARRLNRRAVKRRGSTFAIIVALFIAGTCAVLYIGNIVAVNRLAHEIAALESRHAALVQANQDLEAQIDRKSGFDRVTKFAGERLGLQPYKDQPQFFDVDEERAQNIAVPGE